MKNIKDLILNTCSIILLLIFSFCIINLIWNGLTYYTILSAKTSVSIFFLLAMYNHFFKDE